MVYRPEMDQDEGTVDDGYRVCRVCETRKSMTEFYWANGKKYRSRSCKACWSVRDRARRSVSDPEARSKISFERNLRTKYGMTPEAYAQILESQGGCCAICEHDFGGASPQVDHDHDTGLVRGILCFKCNTALGKFNDDASVLVSALAYLEKGPAPIEYVDKQVSAEESRAKRSEASRAWFASPEGKECLETRLSYSNGKLTLEDRDEIIRLCRETPLSQREVADLFGCSQGRVSQLVRGRS